MELFTRISETLLSPARRIRSFFRTHATASIAAFVVIAVLLVIWARLGFTLDFNRFFAVYEGEIEVVQCFQAGDTFCDGNNVMMWETDDIDGGCVEGFVETCSYQCSGGACVAPPVESVAPSAAPTAEASAAPTAAVGPGVTVVINSTLPLKHEDRLDVSWSALWADSCTASAWIDTGGSTQGRATSDPVSACGATQHGFVVQCCDDVLGCGTANVAFNIDDRYCPTNPDYQFKMFFDPPPALHTSSDGVGHFQNNSMYDEWGTYCVYEMLNGNFDTQVELAHKAVSVKAQSSKNVPLGDVYVNTTCSEKIVQLDLVYANDACGEAPLGHAGSVWDFVIGYRMPGVACSPSVSPSVPPASPSTSPSTPPTSPSTSPSTPPTSPSTSPSTPPSSPSSSPSASPTTLICTPENQDAYTGETVSVRADGGTAPYTWTAPGSSFFDPDGDRASARYNNDGDYEITVRDAMGLTDVCALDITDRPRRRRTPTPDPALEIEKVVRNVTQGISEREAVSARPGDTVEFRIEVSSTGSSTAKDVVVRDTLPDRLTYVTGSTTVDDIAAPDGIIGAGIPLGDMSEDTSKTIRFRATVAGSSAFTHTTTILSNFAYARGSNVPEVNDMAHVSVEIGAPVTQIKTGPGESTVLALIIASIITLLYVGYTGTDTFRRRELEENIDVARRDKDGFNFKR